MASALPQSITSAYRPGSGGKRPDGVAARCTGGDGTAAHTPKAEADSDVSRRHIADDHGDEEGGNAVEALFLPLGVLRTPWFRNRPRRWIPAPPQREESSRSISRPLMAMASHSRAQGQLRKAIHAAHLFLSMTVSGSQPLTSPAASPSAGRYRIGDGRDAASPAGPPLQDSGTLLPTGVGAHAGHHYASFISPPPFTSPCRRPRHST